MTTMNLDRLFTILGAALLSASVALTVGGFVAHGTTGMASTALLLWTLAGAVALAGMVLLMAGGSYDSGGPQTSEQQGVAVERQTPAST